MKKILTLLFALIILYLPLFPVRAQSDGMSEEVLKCLLSGICPEDKKEIRTAGVITALLGEVEYSKDNGLTYLPLSKGDTIYTTYLISTGYESATQIDFGFGEIRIPAATQFRIEKFNTSEELREVQIRLNTGAVRVIMPHTDSIRSDFSVHNTAGFASIRGSEMQVEITQNLEMLVHAIKDTAYIRGEKETIEVEVPEGNSAKVSASQKANTPYTTISGSIREISINAGDDKTQSTPKETKTTGESYFFLIACGIAVIVFGVVIFLFVMKSKRKKIPHTILDQDSVTPKEQQS